MDNYTVKPGSMVSINSQWYRCMKDGRLQRIPTVLVIVVDMDTMNTTHLAFFGHYHQLDETLLPDEVSDLRFWDISLKPDNVATYLRATSSDKAYNCVCEYTDSIEPSDGEDEDDELPPTRRRKRKK